MHPAARRAWQVAAREPTHARPRAGILAPLRSLGIRHAGRPTAWAMGRVFALGSCPAKTARNAPPSHTAAPARLTPCRTRPPLNAAARASGLVGAAAIGAGLRTRRLGAGQRCGDGAARLAAIRARVECPRNDVRVSTNCQSPARAVARARRDNRGAKCTTRENAPQATISVPATYRGGKRVVFGALAVPASSVMGWRGRRDGVLRAAWMLQGWIISVRLTLAQKGTSFSQRSFAHGIP